MDKKIAFNTLLKDMCELVNTGQVTDEGVQILIDEVNRRIEKRLAKGKPITKRYRNTLQTLETVQMVKEI